MSEWTEKGTAGGKVLVKKPNHAVKTQALKVIKDESKLNSQMDREGLLNELQHYKRFALSQFESIRTLKVEIAKIKRMAAAQRKSGTGAAQGRGADANSVSTIEKHLLPASQARDAEELRKENGWLKEMLNEAEEEKKLLKAAKDKYERRARYTLEKFNEIKAKEMHLIQMGEDKVRGEINLINAKYKQKLEV